MNSEVPTPDQAAEALSLLGRFFANDDTGQQDHVKILHECQRLYVDRSESYGQAWEQRGGIANLVKAATKIDRLWAMFVDSSGPPPALHKDALDDAYDGINYLVFFIRCVQGGNVTGMGPKVKEQG